MKDVFRAGGLAIAAAVTAVVVILAISLMAVFGVGWFQRGTANFRGQTSATEKTRANGDYRIASYNVFFDLCAGVQTQEDRIKILQARVDRLKGTDQQADAQTDLDAVEATRASLIREYNAKASRTATEGQFRSSQLPYQLNVSAEETQCTV